MNSTPQSPSTTLPPAEVRLVLPFPPSTNEYWRAARGRGMVPSHKAEAYKARVARAATLARAQPLHGPVRLFVTVYRPRRVGDLDNYLKVLNDALNGLAWLDDEQVVRLEASREDDATSPRVEVHATAERHASREEVDAHRKAKAERVRKARATRNRNRVAKALGKSRLASALRLPRSAP
ncbi:RusA family crossover junction endodeoxyribonuclease [Myxococcus xanthus]|uniref:RusA family crossover junction endodeoxyribonuclease n=1 Tax=Myxococcus xanthus TaxID=34 RepID=UPI001916DF7E|nr:RusA family crossover junction endodeoxyribonuclease [Myxococcus xanthus]QQR46560.1 RusA family crossover junction endodeoxyribonuclease [Myxococcus xanthus]